MQACSSYFFFETAKINFYRWLKIESSLNINLETTENRTVFKNSTFVKTAENIVLEAIIEVAVYWSASKKKPPVSENLFLYCV